MTADEGWSQASLLRPELVLLVDTSWSSSSGSRVFRCRPEIWTGRTDTGILWELLTELLPCKEGLKASAADQCWPLGYCRAPGTITLTALATVEAGCGQ